MTTAVPLTPVTITGHGLTCSYGPTRALTDVCFEAHAGEIVAVFGPNGAGKTTLLKVLIGERRPDRGRVTWEVNGPEAATSSGPVDAHADPDFRGQVGVVSHRTGLYAKLTVAENLAFFAALHRVKLAKPSKSVPALVLHSLAATGAAHLVNRRADSLSQGQRQRVAWARSLLHDPRIILLDEPFTGLDAVGAATFEDALHTFRAAGKVVVLVTHDVPRGLRLADRAVVLRGGAKVMDVAAKETRADDVVGLFSAQAESTE